VEAPTQWRQRWGGLVALAVLVAVAGGVATSLAGGARRAESSFDRFLGATGAPNLVAQVPVGEVVPGEPVAPPSGAMEALDDLAAIPGVRRRVVVLALAAIPGLRAARVRPAQILHSD